MTKYVRIIDGVYKVIEKKNIEDNIIVNGEIIKSEPFYIYWLENYTYNVMSDEIIAEADTIEELCDGFYLKTKRKDTGEIHIQETFFYYDDFLDEFYRIGDVEEFDMDDYWCVNGECFETELVIACGFIETNKGLIYVAKMNEKGDLELI